MGKPYTLVEYNGNTYRDYGDGILRNERGQLAVKPENSPSITSDNAHIYLAQRKAKILQAIESKLTDITKTRLPSEAIAAIVGKRAEIAMNDDTRTGNEAAKIVLSAVDAYQNKQTDNNTTTQRHEYSIDAETQRLLHAILQERRGYSTDVLDVDSGDVGDTENNIE